MYSLSFTYYYIFFINNSIHLFGNINIDMRDLFLMYNQYFDQDFDRHFHEYYKLIYNINSTNNLSAFELYLDNNSKLNKNFHRIERIDSPVFNDYSLYYVSAYLFHWKSKFLNLLINIQKSVLIFYNTSFLYPKLQNILLESNKIIENVKNFISIKIYNKLVSEKNSAIVDVYIEMFLLLYNINIQYNISICTFDTFQLSDIICIFLHPNLPSSIHFSVCLYLNMVLTNGSDDEFADWDNLELAGRFYNMYIFS